MSDQQREHMELSARNQLKGKVTDAARYDHVEITVDIGARLCAAITPRQRRTRTRGRDDGLSSSATEVMLGK
jgi:hypothetical protein